MTIEEDFVVAGAHVRGAVLARSIDANGRVIGYAFRDPSTDVAHSANAAMLREGFAYPLAYDTQPLTERMLLAGLARSARRRKLAVWAHDSTRAFKLASEASIGERGPLIFPKLFRPCLSFLTARYHGYRGGVRSWLETEGGPTNDVVMVRGRLSRLSALVSDVGRDVSTRADPLSIVFVAR